MDCGKNLLCRSCSELRAEVKRGEPPARQATVAKNKAVAGLPQCSMPMQVLVGIGNPGGRYDNTPHNVGWAVLDARSEEHTSELQSLMRISFAGLCLKKKKPTSNHTHLSINHQTDDNHTSTQTQ